jgi:hypothetical protein
MSKNVLLNDGLGELSKNRWSVDMCIKIFNLNEVIFIEWELDTVVYWVEVLVVFLWILESDHINQILEIERLI